jgi:helicase-like protein/SNF2 domain-containing protein
VAHALNVDAPPDANAVRATIAGTWLAALDVPEQLGSVRLFAHQREAAGRLRLLLCHHGGALLADEVGLGKTFTALAATAPAERPLVVAPAVLCAMWRAALERAGMRGDIVSHEALSLGRRAVADGYDVIIVDEAHHARNPATRRYGRLADLARGARIILVSATPLHNTPADLAALLALFLGTGAYELDAARLATYVVRRRRETARLATPVPSAAPVEWLPIRHDESLADALMRVPPPLPPRDGETAAALVACTMVRHWASSIAALRGFLRRRLARAGVLIDLLASGRHLSARELDAWTIGDDAVQLAFPELVVAPLRSSDALQPKDALRAIRLHAAGLRGALDASGRALGDDVERARRLIEIAGRFPDARIVAFAQLAETVKALYRLARSVGGVAALTAAGAEVAGGRLSRGDVLGRFAPRAHGLPAPAAAERVRLLLTTDLLSEGVDLHDAEIVVHLDLPWTPARIEQRLGRVRRIGSVHDVVRSFAIAPPLGAERAIGLLRRLDEKAGAAAHTIGAFDAPFPRADGSASRTSHDEPDAPAECLERSRELLRAWLSCDPEARSASGASLGTDAAVAAVAAMRAGWLALVGSADDPRLLASEDGRSASDDPRVVLRVVRRGGGAGVPVPAADASLARRLAERWLIAAHARVAARRAADASPAHRGCAARLGRLMSSAPLHARPTLARRIAALRPRIDAARGIGAERCLAALLASPLDDATWLAALEASPDLSERAGRPDPARPRVLALLLLIPPPPVP